MRCKRCKSDQFKKHGWTFRAGKKVQQYQCKSCGMVQTEK